MGSILSYSSTSPGKINDPDSITGLTSREKQYIIKTWSEIKKNPIIFANLVFMKYFYRHPNYLNFFPFKDSPVNDLCNNKKFQAHGANVINAITAIIDNVNDKSVLEQLLVENGQAHAKRKIPESAYWNLKIVILDVIKEVLAHKCTEDILVSWDKLLNVAFKVIIVGLDEQM